MRRERLEQAKKVMEALKPLVWTGTLKQLARRLDEFDPMHMQGSEFLPEQMRRLQGVYAHLRDADKPTK